MIQLCTQKSLKERGLDCSHVKKNSCLQDILVTAIVLCILIALGAAVATVGQAYHWTTPFSFLKSGGYYPGLGVTLGTVMIAALLMTVVLKNCHVKHRPVDAGISSSSSKLYLNPKGGTPLTPSSSSEGDVKESVNMRRKQMLTTTINHDPTTQQITSVIVTAEQNSEVEVTEVFKGSHGLQVNYTKTSN